MLKTYLSLRKKKKEVESKEKLGRVLMYMQTNVKAI